MTARITEASALLGENHRRDNVAHLQVLMKPDPHQPNTPQHVRLRPTLVNFVREFRATSVRLFAYVGGIGALALIAFHQLSPLVAGLHTSLPVSNESRAWTQASRPQPAFSAPVTYFSDKSESYDIFRHPDGGRRDILSWAPAPEDPPIAQLEIYRPGQERTEFDTGIFKISARGDLAHVQDVEPAGLLESKFGPVALTRFSSHASGTAQPCLSLARTFDEPRLLITAWACQGEQRSQRQALGCMLDRLTLLSAGNDLKLAELFARAELRRAGCRTTD